MKYLSGFIKYQRQQTERESCDNKEQMHDIGGIHEAKDNESFDTKTITRYNSPREREREGEGEPSSVLSLLPVILSYWFYFFHGMQQVTLQLSLAKRHNFAYPAPKLSHKQCNSLPVRKPKRKKENNGSQSIRNAKDPIHSMN